MSGAAFPLDMHPCDVSGTALEEFTLLIGARPPIGTEGEDMSGAAFPLGTYPCEDTGTALEELFDAVPTTAIVSLEERAEDLVGG